MFRHDLLCLGDVPWGLADARTRHLLARAARDRFVFYWEEPIEDAGEPRVELHPADDGVMLATAHLPAGLTPELAEAAQRALVDDLLATQRIVRPVLWYRTAAALGFTRHVRARAVVADCHAPVPPGDERAALLLRRADVVLAAGHVLADQLRERAGNVHVVPPAIDADPYVAARGGAAPIDLARIPGPRIGFAGTLDARIDLALVDELAARRPDLQLVLLGAIVGDPARLPARANVRWLGQRDDAARPAYLAALDAVILPFRRDDLTRAHAPGEALEAIAAGLPVVATPLRDLVRPYAEAGVLRLAGCASTMSTALDEVLAEDPLARLARADAFLAERTWEHAWTQVWGHVDAAIRTRTSGVHAIAGTVSAAAAPRRRRAPASPR